MTDEAAFEWPQAADLRALLNHHAADSLRSFALDLAVGQPAHALISVGEVRHAARMRAHRLDGCDATLWNDADGLPCCLSGPHKGHRYEATAGLNLKDSEAAQ